MKKIHKPTKGVDIIFKACISRIEDLTLKKRLELCISELLTGEKDFCTKFKTNEIHKIVQLPIINGNVTTNEMKKVYTYRMAKKDSPGRVYYDEILASAPTGKCPLCGQRIATTIDHYLPKSKFPLYAVTPINLIPACRDCNTTKLQENPSNSEEETLHPYFDDIEFETWLKSKIISSSPPSFEFYVETPSDWTTLLQNRIKNHMKVFDIYKLYSSHAAEELSNIQMNLEMLLSKGGSKAVSDHLKEAYLSRKAVSKNTWQTAMYEAMWQDSWFCNGGFKIV